MSEVVQAQIVFNTLLMMACLILQKLIEKVSIFTLRHTMYVFFVSIVKRRA